MVIQNRLAQEVSLANLVEIFARPHFEAYQPLHLLSYWLDVPWAGTSGPVIHAVSLALWALSLIAVFEASRALGLTSIAALVATLIVGLHPAQVEAVSWATGRKDVLALGFAALTVLCHCRSRAPFDRWRFASLAAFAAAALSKTTALPLPLVLLAADVLLLEREWKRSLLGVAPALAVTLALGALTVWLWSDAAMIRELGPGPRVALIGATVTHYLGTAVFPSSLSPLYAIHRGGAFGLWSAMAGPLALLGLWVAAWRSGVRELCFGLLAFGLLLLPVSNLIPLYFQWQDRYLSLPLWPLAFMVGVGLDRLRGAHGQSWRALALGAVLVGLLGARTAQYSSRWRDDLTLFGHAASTHPGAFYAWLQLGHARVRAQQLDGAIVAYERAIEAANLAVGHHARFRTVLLIDERDRGLTPSRADALTSRFASVRGDPGPLRELAGEMAEAGYRRAVMLALDYSFAQSPVSDDALERAALIQAERGHGWLADYYLSRLRRHPILPANVARVTEDEDE